MAKKKTKAPGDGVTILALKRPEPPTTKEKPVSVDTPSPLPLPEKPSIPVTNSTEETQESDPQPESRERKPKSPPLQVLDSINTGTGEVVRAGDRILVTAPWGQSEPVEVIGCYEGDGSAWAQFKPIESCPPDWTWEGGVKRL